MTASTLHSVDVASRWARAGRSHERDPEAAGRAAAGEAFSGRDDPRLVIVFASAGYDADRLLFGVRSVTGDAPLIGCTTAGEISGDGPGDLGVVVLALGGDGLRVATSAHFSAAGGLREAGARVAEAMFAVPRQEHRVLLLLSDGLSGDQAEVVRGAYSVLGAEVPLVGGCAGDDLRMSATRQLHGGDVLEGAVVGAAIASDAPIGIGVSHGWRRVGEPMLVTSSSGSRVLALDDQAALDVYLDRLDAPAEARADAAGFSRWAMTHPLGLSRRSREEVRFVAGGDFGERSLLCVANVPQGGLVWFMAGDDASTLEATDAACAAALRPLDRRPPTALVAFDCIARRGVLGETGIRREVERISAHGGGAPIAGFYTYGEIARTRGTGGFHNQTLVVLAFG